MIPHRGNATPLAPTRRPPDRRERGMVTAEIALGTLAVIMVAVAIAWLIGGLTQQVRCADVASEVARQEARGDRAAADRARGRAPRGASVETVREGGQVVTTVRLDYRPLEAAPAVSLRARSVVLLEPGE